MTETHARPSEPRVPDRQSDPIYRVHTALGVVLYLAAGLVLGAFFAKILAEQPGRALDTSQISGLWTLARLQWLSWGATLSLVLGAGVAFVAAYSAYFAGVVFHGAGLRGFP